MLERKPRGLIRTLLAAASTTAITAFLHAQAQEAPDTGAAETAPNANSETVVVIGQRFQNSLVNRLPIDPEKLPYSVEIIDEEALHDRGVFNPLDILETLPNVVRRQTQYLPTGGSYLIRGLYGTVLTNNRPENDSRGSGRRDSSQIERIEVLKGPVSILLGPVIPGGVVNQVTKSPEDTDFVELIGRAGSYGTYRVEADVNDGALFGSNIFSGRLTLAQEDQQSPQDPANVETFSVRPVLEANFTDRTRAQASVSYTKRESVPFSQTAVNSDGSVPETIDEETYFGVPSVQAGEDTYYDAEFQHEFLDSLKLVVRGSYQDTDFDYQTSQNGYNYAGGRGFGPGDTDAYVYYSVGYRDTEVKYGDVQLVGNFDAFGQRQDWVVGASSQATTFASFWAFGGVLGIVDITDIESAVYGVPDYNLALTPYRDIEDELSSVYAETNFRPTDRLTIVAGARYDDYEQTNLATGDVSTTDDTTFRIGATYELPAGLNAYVSYAESFVPQSGMVLRPGESYTDPNALSDPIDPETATNYEAGLKGSLFDGRVGLTAAIFSLTRQNVSTSDPNNQPTFPGYVVATGEQKHEGIELSARFEVSEAVNLDLSYGYVDAEITNVISAGSGEDVGDPVALVPSHTFSAYGTYTVQDGPAQDLRLGLGVRGISERPAPRWGLVYDGYTLVDALVAYPISENIDVQLNVHNLLDEEYRETVGYNNGTTGGGHRFGNPRSAYATIRARF